MDDKKMKATALVPSVGADGGQPLTQKPTPSITEDCAENNPPEKDLDEMLRQMQRFNAPAYLPTVSMNELYENVYQSRPPVIDGLEEQLKRFVQEHPAYHHRHPAKNPGGWRRQVQLWQRL
nr:hypothetical protein [Enterocloster lavalensis]